MPHSKFWDNSCFKSYQSKRLLWRWAFRHSDAQPGHHETRWRRSHFSPPFPESFRKLNGSMLFWTLRCFVIQWLLYVCNASPIWDQQRQRHSAPREPESKHSTVEPSNCNICCRTRRYNCCGCQWWANWLGVLLFIIPPSTFYNSPFGHSNKLSLLLPPPLPHFFSSSFSSTSFYNRSNYLSIQFACSSSTRLLNFLHPGTQQWRCSKARCLQIPRLWVEKNTTNHKCRPFLLQAVSAKKSMTWYKHYDIIKRACCKHCHTLYIRWKDLAAESGLFTNTWEDADNLDFCTELLKINRCLVADSQCVLECCCQNLSGEPWSGHRSTCTYVLNKRCCRCGIPSTKNHCIKWTCRFLSWMEVLVFTSSDQLSEKKGAPAKHPLKTYHQKEVWNTDSEITLRIIFLSWAPVPSFPTRQLVMPLLSFPRPCPWRWQQVEPIDTKRTMQPCRCLFSLYRDDESTEATGRLKRTKSHVSLPWPSPTFPSSACRCPWWQPRFRSWQTKPHVKCMAQQEALPEMDAKW